MGTIHAHNAGSLSSLSADIEKLDKNITGLQSSLSSDNEEKSNTAALLALQDLRGSIQTATAALSSMPSNQYFDIPQSVSSMFTGREALLSNLGNLFDHEPSATIASLPYQKRFVIYGLGGSGKTQFCCKFAQDNRHR
jgi:hypothetical protein